MLLPSHFRVLLLAVTVLIVMEDLQYLLKIGSAASARIEMNAVDFCDECEEEGEGKSETEENSKEETKKKDENRHAASASLPALYTLTVKNVLRHASCHITDVAPEMETPPPEV